MHVRMMWNKRDQNERDLSRESGVKEGLGMLKDHWVLIVRAHSFNKEITSYTLCTVPELHEMGLLRQHRSDRPTLMRMRTSTLPRGSISNGISSASSRARRLFNLPKTPEDRIIDRMTDRGLIECLLHVLNNE